MASHVRPAVNGIMFSRGNRFKKFGVITLHPRGERCSHLSRQERIFSVRLLPASPARIAKDVDVRRPISKPIIIEVVVLALRLEILRAALYGNQPAFAMEEVGVPG